MQIHLLSKCEINGNLYQQVNTGAKCFVGTATLCKVAVVYLVRVCVRERGYLAKGYKHSRMMDISFHSYFFHIYKIVLKITLVKGILLVN